MRLTGIAASIALFALLTMMRSIYLNWDGWTAGASSIIGLPTYVNAPVAAVAAIAAIIAAVYFRESRTGLLLRASMDDRIAAQAAGVNVYLARLIALVISAFFMGIAGVLMGHLLGTLSVAGFWLDITFMTLAMLVIGGMTSVTGAVVGAVGVKLVIEILRQLEQGITVGDTTISLPGGSQEVILAITMILFLIYRREGLMAGGELWWPIGRRAVRAYAMKTPVNQSNAE
jgi:branched-chain amino acid transport system permease protein